LLGGGTALGDVTIHCIDVGQGDATLIVSSSGQTMLIDGGWNGSGTSIIIPYLNSLGIGQLSYMGVTHYHADHIGGLDEVYNAKGVSQAVYDRGWSYTTATYNTYAATVASKRAAITDGQVIDLGDGVTVRCLGLNGNGQLSPPYNNSVLENEYDVAYLVECGDFDFFVAGDLIGPDAGNIEVYQVNHHGSYTSSNVNFLNATQPEVAIISVGSNSYGHPHQEALNRLSNAGAFVYQTEPGSGGTLPPSELRVVNGHVVVTSDGYGEYFVDGDEWVMDEFDPTPVPFITAFQLQGNDPNPFNPTTEIRFESARGGPVQLSIYDLTGRRVYERRLVVENGPQSIRWTGVDNHYNPLPSGVYLYRVVMPDGAGSGRMMLVK
jgi:beta-lactamase superfamily II metal-dependent hydrolase